MTCNTPSSPPGTRNLTLSLCVLIGLVSVAPAVAGPDAPGLVISDPWIRFIVPTLPAAGYFDLANHNDTPRVLVGASSPACKSLMLHQTMTMNGMETMAMVASVMVPAKGSVSFAPGGYHLMCTGPSSDMTVGATVAVTLNFKDGETITANFAVRGATGK